MKFKFLRFTLLSMLVMLCGNAFADDTYVNTEATFSWLVGNENAATITGTDVADAVKSTKVKAGFDLTTGTKNDYAANQGNMMVTYQPGTSNPGAVAADMVEYTIKLKKGVKFTLTSISYDALKEGTDNASFKWSYTVDGEECTIADVPKDKIIRNNNTTGTPALNHVETIADAKGGETVTFRIYVSGFANNKKLAISNVKINGLINGTVEQRSFKDFKVDFRVKNGDNNYTVILPTTGELPSGISIDATKYNGNQHGVQNPTITVPVDGPVKFTIGSCQYGGHTVTIEDANGGSVSVDNNYGCENGVSDITSATYNKYATYTYNNETPTTLTFKVNGYLPFFFAEACDFIESCDVTYYDVDGKTIIGTKTVDGGSDLVYAYGASDVTVAEGKAFRGWFASTASTATKVPEGTTISEDTKLYAKATDIEVAEVGKMFNYDLTKPYFYAEDHELFTAQNGKYYNNHGWAFGKDGAFSIQVAGKAQIVLTLCQFGTAGAIKITNAGGTEVGTIESSQSAADGGSATFNYTGEATTLTFSFASTNVYLHGVKVYNVNAFPVKDAETGYYIIPANDAAGLILALNNAASEPNAKIFLPNGTYDLGDAVENPISGTNVSIIGESAENTIIVTKPELANEGLDKADLFKNSSTGLYMQDLTLKNAMTYDGKATGRAACLHDVGTQTVCKNVNLLSFQDTYYSHRVGGLFYFEGGELHGTVDYLCGNGKVYFNKVTLVNEALKAVTMTANSELYVFNECLVKNNGTCKDYTYNFGRAWSDNPVCIFLNTTLEDPSTLLSTRWNLSGINSDYSIAGEYGTMNTMGGDITPAENTITFKINSTTMNTILTSDQAANYTIDKVLGTWATTAQQQATQLEAPSATYANNQVTWTPADDGATGYMIEKNGEFVGITTASSFDITIDPAKDLLTIRSANPRGGFGEAKQVENTATKIDAVNTNTKQEDNVIYNLQGMRVSKPTRGIYIINGKKVIMK